MKPSRAKELVDACRVPAGTKPAERGLWNLRELRIPDDGKPSETVLEALDRLFRPSGLAPGDTYYALTRWTDASLHMPWGEVVMEDTPNELRRHLPILTRARGCVLVTGLGLGCVLRGLLSKPEVDHVDVVEIDPHVLELVAGEFAGNPRVTIHRGDSETIAWPAGTRWDYAWHDAWVENGSLQVLHARLLMRYRDMVPKQGVWGLDRDIKKQIHRRAPGTLALV